MENQSLITEDEIKKIFAPAKRRGGAKNIFKSIIKEIIYMVIIFVVSFSIVNWPAVSQHLKYWWNIDYRNQTSIQNPTPAQAVPKNGSQIIISKIGVEAPITWDIPYTEIIPKLRDGVVHYKGTAHPNEVGNVFIIGHSSDYIWSDGKYKDIFALIDKLVAGDRIKIIYKDQVYLYEVYDAMIIKPSQTEVLNPTDQPILTLMTCYPVGSTRNRLVVQAKLISQPGNLNQNNSPQIFPLPSTR